MEILNEYLKLESKLFEYFGYKEDWVKIPVEDSREMHWELHGEEYGGYVRYHEDENVLNDKDSGEYYQSDIYTQRFLSKWVYRGEEYTMICTDPHVDGNKFLSIFTNTKEIKCK